MKTTSARVFRLAALAALIWVASPALAQRMALAPGEAAPELKGANYPVETAFKADWSANSFTLVNFWATWCEPCRKEIPALEALYRANQDRGFVIYGVFEPWEKPRIKSYLNTVKVEVTYPLIRPAETVDYYWGGIAIKPTSFLVDSSGTILRKYVGAKSEQTKGIGDDVHALLAGKPLPPQVMPTDPLLSPEEEERVRKKSEQGVIKKKTIQSP